MRIIVIAMALMTLFSCVKKEEKIPATVISNDSLVLILQDIEIIDAGLTTLANQGQDVRPLIKPYYDKLCDKYHISYQRLDSSMNYYFLNPEKIDTTYQQAITELIQKQSKSLYNGK